LKLSDLERSSREREGESMEYYNWSELPARDRGKGIRLRTVHSQRMTAAHWEFEPETDLPEHSHPHEQLTLLQEGDFELTVGGVSRRLRIGDVVVIPPQVPHSGRALSASRVIDIFAPVREDFKEDRQ
jgi:quercetin dioxygenase-like cupin family protein